MAAAKGRKLVGAVDQGTSSSRFLIFDSATAELLTYHQTETHSFYPKEGWVEQDPKEILSSVLECIDKAVGNLQALNVNLTDICAIGITNQRETLVVWDKNTGEPLHNAIIWLDTRTAETVEKLLEKCPGGNKDFLRSRCGLPISTYFTAVKIRWVFDNSKAVRQALSEGRCCVGNVDTWLLWNLTGGVNGGKYLTDVTNASRTMLMNLHSLTWDEDLCRFFDIPKNILPEIKSSSEIYGKLSSTALKGLPISGILGDQQAALVGQMCLKPGLAKNTYGTGCFLLYNTGSELVKSEHGLLTTVAYKFGSKKPACYALEGSVAIAGAAVQWMRDNLGVIKTSAEIETLASSVDTTHGCYFVPAFSGLFCPYWQPDAKGIICGLSQFTTKAHIARSCLEAVCFQTRELLEAMDRDSGIPITSLQVDGGMTANTLLMQLQSDLVGIPVVRPSMPETTALGAAMAAGAAEGIDVWKIDAHNAPKITTDTFHPSVTESNRDDRFEKWKEAVKRSMHWDAPVSSQVKSVNIWTSVPGGVYILSSFGLLILAKVWN